MAISEASGAVYVPAADGRPAHILVVSDSGNDGQFAEIDPIAGDALRIGRLPLERPRAASDDIEGLSRVGDTLYALTSSGAMRHYRARADGRGYDLVRGPYAIAVGPGTEALACASPLLVNCGANFEGLCLRDAPAAAAAATDDDGGEPPVCAGFAVAKAEGALRCLVWSEDGALRVDPARTIALSWPKVLSGCDFDPAGDAVWVGTNFFGGSQVYRITGWRAPETARFQAVGSLGRGFPEAIAVGPDGALWRFSDTGGAGSLIDRFACAAPR